MNQKHYNKKRIAYQHAVVISKQACIYIPLDVFPAARLQSRHKPLEDVGHKLVKWFLLSSRFRASFTSYASFRLRAQKLWVFDWRCCYTDEVRVESVGRLSDVTDSRSR